MTEADSQRAARNDGCGRAPAAGYLNQRHRLSKDKCRRCKGEGIMNWEHHGGSQRVICTSCHGTGESADSDNDQAQRPAE